MGKTNFQSLKELTTSLAKKLDMLANGKLKLNEIELITEQAREIYERLVIIRFKSYEEKDESTTPTRNSESETKKSESMDNSVADEEEDLMMFDFTAVNEENDNSADTIVNKPAPKKQESPQKEDGNDSSLNDNFKKADGSVGKKYQKAAITDLKEHIGINRKFLYVNDLFAGDSNAYNLAIGKLNSCATKKDAIQHVEKLKTDQNWDNENSTVVGFIDLVERRYIV